MMPPTSIHHEFWAKRPALITICVATGNALPDCAKIGSNCGTTLINSSITDDTATISSSVG